MSKSTITHLPGEIEALIPENERTTLINQIISEARQGEFHDYRNEKYVCGKVQIVQMLRETKDARLNPIIQGVMDGDYDESPNEDDTAAMKKDWLENGGTKEEWNKLFPVKF